MKMKNTSVSIAAVVLVLAGGLPLTAIADDPDRTYQTANIVDINTGIPVAGAATLTRTEDSVTARIYASGLDTGAAYTIWWVVWNDPTQCAGGPGGCALGDLGVTGNSVFYAGGFVTGADGTANVSVTVVADDLAAGIDVLLGNGLDEENGFGAEMHLVLRTHGNIIAGMADLQIGSFNGGCPPNTCTDTLAAVFAPVDVD